MKNNKPLVSIIVPCYNQSEFLPEALESVLYQSYEKWECIIVNDGSPDNTDTVAKSWLAKDKRYKYLFQENAGVSNARNSGITQSNGEFILPLDADDKISPDYVELAVKELESNQNLKLVYCNASKFGDEDLIWKLDEFSLKNLAKFNMIFCSALYRRRDWDLIGGYDNKMITGFEDWEFWISILKSEGEVKKLDIIGFYYRILYNSRTKQLTPDKEKVLYEYMSIKHADFFVNQLGSFFELRSRVGEVEKLHQIKLHSEKYVIDLFLKTFLGFTLFGKYKQ
jgi:glycosyltransferase involved in cell wall biosynthesis